VTRTLAQYAGMGVLIVDDNESNIALLKALIHEEGLTRVFTETDSRKVRERLREHRPDLVLLDLHMPHVDGLQVLAQIKAHAAGDYLPVLVLTADTTTGARDQALSHGAQDFLTKPFDAVETTLRIANLLETRELHANLRRAGVLPAPSSPEPAPDPELTRRRIQGVLDGNRVTPVYQPIVDLDTREAVGYEGLSRFYDTRHGGPDRWFDDAFTVGLGVELEWSAAQTLLPFLDQIPDGTFLAINMSPATVLHVMENELCPPKSCPSIVIELTERVPIQDYAAVRGALADMRSLGARLAADDRGSGFAGFRHLVSLAPDIIKLDIGLLRDFHFKSGQLAITNALVTFAEDVGAQVIAEGVENAAELELLHDLGVGWAQGYHLGMPSPAREWVTSS
jgi:EAL domain-containing protein (putative c-di-GMP-specific phosphodiesterase class I)/ActR/RegA family two-component response regulator